MRKDGGIRLTGTVTEALPERGYWVELPNGHRMFGCERRGELPRRDEDRLKPGDKVDLVASPFDLSKGMILRDRKD